MKERRFYVSIWCTKGLHASCTRICVSCEAYCLCDCHKAENVPRERRTPPSPGPVGDDT